MVRLLVSGTNDAAGQQVALRIREATIEACPDTSALDVQPESYDAVVFVGIAAPEKDMVKRLLQAGKHVVLAAKAWFDDPDAPATGGGGQLAVVNPDHYLPSRQLIRRQLQEGKLGEAVLVRIHRWESADDRRDFVGLPPTLVGDIELAAWLMGKGPDRVYAAGLTTGAPFVQVHLGYPGGGMALIDHCDHLPPGDGYHSLAVIGSAGAAYADDHQNMQLVFQGGHPRAVRTGEDNAGWLFLLLQEYVEALQSGRADRFADPLQWQSVHTTVAAVQRSLLSRQAVDLEER